MKQYYLERLHWIFNYTSKNVFYVLAKTLCILIGLPIYAVMFVVEMVLTAVHMIFSWIPVFNVFIMVICKSLIYVVDKTFYICILTDIRKFREAMRMEPAYEVTDAPQEGQTEQDAEASVEVVDTQESAAEEAVAQESVLQSQSEAQVVAEDESENAVETFADGAEHENGISPDGGNESD